MVSTHLFFLTIFLSPFAPSQCCSHLVFCKPLSPDLGPSCLNHLLIVPSLDVIIPRSSIKKVTFVHGNKHKYLGLELAKKILVGCLSYFYIAMTRHHDQGIL